MSPGSVLPYLTLLHSSNVGSQDGKEI